MVARTKLRDRILPDYTKGEEIFNMVSHIVGGGFGIIALVLCVVVSALNGDPWAVVSSAVYGASMVCLYTMSSVYHGLRANMGKKVLQVLDHCTIYFLIAGTYTPILLVSVRPQFPVIAWVLFGFVWTLAILAGTLTAIDLKKYAVFSMVCYILMGWCVIAAMKPVTMAVGMDGMSYIFFGGVAYTIGAVLYGIGSKKRWMHSVFHIFVVLGSILQFFGILFYVL